MLAYTPSMPTIQMDSLATTLRASTLFQRMHRNTLTAEAEAENRHLVIAKAQRSNHIFWVRFEIPSSIRKIYYIGCVSAAEQSDRRRGDTT